jgi:hypothetical protein
VEQVCDRNSDQCKKLKYIGSLLDKQVEGNGTALTVDPENDYYKLLQEMDQEYVLK